MIKLHVEGMVTVELHTTFTVQMDVETPWIRWENSPPPKKKVFLLQVFRKSTWNNSYRFYHFHVCMCMSVYVHMHVCVHACICVYASVYVCTCMWFYEEINFCICILHPARCCDILCKCTECCASFLSNLNSVYVCVCVNVCVCVCVCIHMCVCVCVCVCV